MSFFVWVWHHLYQDFWPPDASRVAPNLLASLICLIAGAFATYLVYPRFRRLVDGWVTSHLESVTGHVEERHGELAEMLAHIIRHHPDIPPLGTVQPAKFAAPKEDPMTLPTAVIADIESRFRPVTKALTTVMNDADAALHSQVGQALEAVAKTVLDVIPQGREASLVLTKLEEAAQWAHSALTKASAAPVQAAPAPGPGGGTGIPGQSAPAAASTGP